MGMKVSDYKENCTFCGKGFKVQEASSNQHYILELLINIHIFGTIL